MIVSYDNYLDIRLTFTDALAVMHRQAILSAFLVVIALALFVGCCANQPGVPRAEGQVATRVTASVEGIVAPAVEAHCLAIYEVRGEPGLGPSGSEPMSAGALSGAAGRCGYDAAASRWLFLPEERGFEGRLRCVVGAGRASEVLIVERERADDLPGRRERTRGEGYSPDLVAVEAYADRDPEDDTLLLPCPILEHTPRCPDGTRPRRHPPAEGAEHPLSFHESGCCVRDDGTLHGPSWDRQGGRWARLGHYRDGRRHGFWLFWNEESPFVLREAGTWLEDERGVLEHGLFTTWNAGGTKYSERRYREGELSHP